MTTAAQLYAGIEAQPAAGPNLIVGSRTLPLALSFAGDQKYESGFSITNTSADNFNSDIVWTTGDGGVDTFGFLWLIADQDAIVEFRNTNADTVVFLLFAGVPLALGADDMLVGPLGADGSATSLPNPIDRITIKNNTTGAPSDAVVTGRLLLFN